MKNFNLYNFYDEQVKALEETIIRIEETNNGNCDGLIEQKERLEEIRDSYK